MKTKNWIAVAALLGLAACAPGNVEIVNSADNVINVRAPNTDGGRNAAEQVAATRCTRAGRLMGSEILDNRQTVIYEYRCD